MKKLSEQKAGKAYRYAGTVRKAAKLLGVSHRTLLRALQAAGVERSPPGGSWKRGRYIPSHHTSELADWLRRHPSVRLPRSPSKIAFVVGCSVDTVKCYLYRRRKYERKSAEALVEPYLKGFGAEYAEGTWTMEMDPYSYRLTIKGISKSGTLFRITTDRKEMQNALVRATRETDRNRAVDHQAVEERQAGRPNHS